MRSMSSGNSDRVEYRWDQFFRLLHIFYKQFICHFSVPCHLCYNILNLLIFIILCSMVFSKNGNLCSLFVTSRHFLSIWLRDIALNLLLFSQVQNPKVFMKKDILKNLGKRLNQPITNANARITASLQGAKLRNA